LLKWDRFLGPSGVPLSGVAIVQGCQRFKKFFECLKWWSVTATSLIVKIKMKQKNFYITYVVKV